MHGHRSKVEPAMQAQSPESRSCSSLQQVGEAVEPRMQGQARFNYHPSAYNNCSAYDDDAQT